MFLSTYNFFVEEDILCRFTNALFINLNSFLKSEACNKNGDDRNKPYLIEHEFIFIVTSTQQKGFYLSRIYTSISLG